MRIPFVLTVKKFVPHTVQGRGSVNTLIYSTAIFQTKIDLFYKNVSKISILLKDKAGGFIYFVIVK